jgi:limonene-1,2-epoxide hydrolase
MSYAARMEPKELVRKWVDVFNRRDVDTLVTLYEEDAINHQVAEDPVRGRPMIREMLRKGFAAAEMVCIVENIFQDGEWAILEWRDPKGLRGCGFFHVKNDKIVFQRGYWDKLSFVKTHGVPLDA